jgi:hypothetical protein
MEIFVVPQAYRGPFIAIFGQQAGAFPEWRGDTAVYRVPDNGILRVALPEPPHSTKAVLVFANAPNNWIGNYPTCADMRVYVTDDRPRVCWLDYSVGGTGIPDHIVAVVTDWTGIPDQFNRTSFVYDSAVLGRKKANRHWEEPRDLPRQRPVRKTE